MVMNNWNTYSTEELASIFSDYHKDVHGMRPRWIDHTDRTVLLLQLESLDAHMATMKSTPEGREQLRADGWHAPEPEDDGQDDNDSDIDDGDWDDAGAYASAGWGTDEDYGSAAEDY
jgi:hypothetical protein